VVAAVEPVGQAQHGGEDSHRAPVPWRERSEARIAPARPRLAMITRQQRDDRPVELGEPSELTVLDDVSRVVLVPLVADVLADVVQERRILEQLAIGVAQAVQLARLIEQRQR
jgi:hypothetical protein